MSEKQCSKCRSTLPLEAFGKDRYTRSGRKSACKECRAADERKRTWAIGGKRDRQEERYLKRKRAEVAAEAARAEREERKRAEYAAKKKAEAEARLSDDYAQLKPEDFDVTIANDGRIDKSWTRDKRQEYSRSMGEWTSSLREAAVSEMDGEGGVLGGMDDQHAAYIVKLSEQERRFQNRRLARSMSLSEAHEVLAMRRFKIAAHEYLSGKVTPTGYAAKPPPRTPRKRTVCLLLSDLHLGAELSSLDSPIPFRAIEEARRLEFVLRQALDYKPQHRDNSKLLLILNGDLVEGQLMHDFRDGAPLTEQKVVFWRYFRAFMGYVAQAYPNVHVVCQPGNHGRDKVRHPGRATSRKWDGHEWEMYYALREMCSDLNNVTWQIDFRAVSAVDLHGSILGVTHGDTEIKLSDPDTRAKQNAQEIDRINSTRIFGVEFDAWAFGHFHKPRYQPRNPRVVFNGALVPSNGYARSAGHIGEPCGQFLWEAVEGYPVGDVRFIEVGRAQDEDEQLGKLIEPFRFSSND